MPAGTDFCLQPFAEMGGERGMHLLATIVLRAPVALSLRQRTLLPPDLFARLMLR